MINKYDLLINNLTDDTNEQQIEKMKLIAAIAKAHIPSEQVAAAQLWQELQNSSNADIIYQANYNSIYLAEGKCGIPNDYSCREPFSTIGRIDEIFLHRVNHYNEQQIIQLDTTSEINLMIQKENQSLVYRYFIGYKPYCSLQQIFKPKAINRNYIFLQDGLKLNVQTSNIGYLLTCKENKSIFLLSSDNEPLEWAKYYIH